jgi:deferrochelatase/peroxidase EfeB
MVAFYGANPVEIDTRVTSFRSHMKETGAELTGTPNPGATVLGADIAPLTIVAERSVLWPATSDGELREHFGYIDGAGEPDIEGLSEAIHAIRREASPDRELTARPRELGVYDNERGDWRAIKPGEFVFGLENEGGGITPQPREEDRGERAQFDLYRLFLANGTFVAYRHLHQRVRTFRRYLQLASETSGLTPEGVAARLVGRWRNAAPLGPNQTEEDATAFAQAIKDRARPRSDLNAFNYMKAGEREGEDALRVPRGAHVRRANPRDGLPGDPTGVKRRRMLRRGIPYGAALLDSDGRSGGLDELSGTDDREQRGLVFMCLQVNLAGQYELVQREWLNDGDVFGQSRDRDALTGGEPAQLIIPGFRRPVLSNIPAFVEVRGGAYFLKPSVDALDWMSKGYEGTLGAQ